MERCPKDEAQLKILLEIKALPIPEKNWKNLLGGGIHTHPLAIGGLSARNFSAYALLNFSKQFQDLVVFFQGPIRLFDFQQSFGLTSQFASLLLAVQ